MKSVSVVIVTHNRRELLKECLASILRQTYPIERIFVIDNASTDGTQALLLEAERNDPRIVNIYSQINTGGAGGFHMGLEAAMKSTCSDWFWVMDDDVEATPNALSGLIKYSDRSECIHGKRLNPNGSTYFWEASFVPSIGFSIPRADPTFRSGKEYAVVNVACFEGMLTSRNLIQKIGLPDPRFFIAWDDTVFGYLASKHTDVLYVNHTTLVRKRCLKSVQLGFRTLNETSDMYRYYHIKNRELVKQYLIKLNEYRPFPFNAMTAVLIMKEYLRAILLQRKFGAFKSLIKGLRDGLKDF